MMEMNEKNVESYEIPNTPLTDKQLWGFPLGVYFIIPSEMGERFSFYGMRVLLNQYLKSGFGITTYLAKSYVHLFNAMVYLIPLAGAAVSDSYLGKYHTIVIATGIFALGTSLLAILSINGLVGEYGSFPLWSFLVPSMLAAVGVGGVKPCVSSHGGDQFKEDQKRQQTIFFTALGTIKYLGIFLSVLSLPYIKEGIQCWNGPCYFIALGIPGLMSILALVIFIVGHRYYNIVPPQGEFILWKVIKAMSLAGRRWWSAPKPNRNQMTHWLDFALDDYEPTFLEEIKNLGLVVVAFIPITFVFILEEQSLTEWQNQYEVMNKYILGLYVPTDASSFINPFLVILSGPVAEILFRYMERKGISMPDYRRLVLAYILVITAFTISTVLQIFIDQHSQGLILEHNIAVSCEGCLNGLWQLPQWFLLSFGQAIIVPSTISLAYHQVGTQIKASAVAICLLSIAIANYSIMGMELLFHNWEPLTRSLVYLISSIVAFFVYCSLEKLGYVKHAETN